MTSKDWKSYTLAEVANWTSGGTPDSKNPEYYGGGIPWVVIGDLTEGKVTRTEKTLTDFGLENSSAKILPKGTVMVAMYGASIGRTGYMGAPMATNQAIACASSNNELIVPEFLLVFLQSQKQQFISAGRGGAQPNISQSVIKAWPISLPSLEEQKFIVDAVYNQLAKLKYAKRNLDLAQLKSSELHSSILRAAVTGQIQGSD